MFKRGLRLPDIGTKRTWKSSERTSVRLLCASRQLPFSFPPNAKLKHYLLSSNLQGAFCQLQDLLGSLA